MAIIEAEFELEAELEQWVKSNLDTFFPYFTQLDGFRISTPSGKYGIPDGFAFDFVGRKWYIIECELLKHGVWPHIAEQVTRYTVASQSSDTQRIVRDRLFEALYENGLLDSAAIALGVCTDRVHQQIELFLQSVSPHLVIFIDQVNIDLEDFVNALDIDSGIYRVKKLLVNGGPNYYSPDCASPAIEVEQDSSGVRSDVEYEVLGLLGNSRLKASNKRFRCYELEDGRVINIKRSKLHEVNNYYWYGVGASGRELMEQYGVTHVVFVMDDFGFATVPIEMLNEFLKSTKTSQNADGSIRHYHVLISNEAEPMLYWSNEVPKIQLSEFFHTFD